ncbi:MAG TPA: isoprenylcysteine carboxylmethyltransferase family protein [Stellaceae bacterium]|nr:isoprenylcysteine carboxylmethyltransferase family protein [Stellaceae bacterium]
MSPVAIAVALVAAERLAELALSQRNVRALKRAGAVEHGRAQYPWIVVLHAAWLASLFAFVPHDARPIPALIALYVALQFVRVWAIASLGRFWTTRIVTLPGAKLVATGPYRFLRHPIYAVVVAEIALLPLSFGDWPIALGFSAANLALLAWRIRLEDRALAPRRLLTFD